MSKDAAKSPPSPTGNPAFSAVLLAGGKSTRMGRDKAAIIVEGQPLWQRQLATLAALGPREVFISGRPDGPYLNGGTEVIHDLHPNCGPLSGLETACWRMQTPLLCVLAVDLPWMTPAFLERLVKMAMQDGRGVVPQNGEYFEPLAAVYPRAILNLIGEQMRQSDLAMQRLIRRAIELDLVIPYALAENERLLFRNVNTPAALAGD
ncbi:MAG: molybdenum cofactor guanylyltransferase [Chthoniobacter sp.]|uniref:molybdenum cofactor guanylyltransferase n=1 Tax=Chthoniobacter sp. TaxID=2510640 RepID=UPI0032A66246